MVKLDECPPRDPFGSSPSFLSHAYECVSPGDLQLHSIDMLKLLVLRHTNGVGISTSGKHFGGPIKYIYNPVRYLAILNNKLTKFLQSCQGISLTIF